MRLMDIMTKKRTFWIKLALYVLPFAVGFTALTGSLVYIGESMPLRWVVWLQQRDDSVLFLNRYGNRDLEFKRLSVNARRPEVMALGSSRILQFRAGFFTYDPSVFYNAAGPGWGLSDVSELLMSVDQDALPKVLLLALSHPWFHDTYNIDIDFSDASDFANLFAVNRTLIQELMAGERFDRDGFDVLEYLERADPGGDGLALGMRAIRDGHGFRSDGSERYGDFLVAGWLGQEQQRESHMELMRAGDEMYVDGDTVSPEKLTQLDELLAYAAENEVTVIGYLPPYMPSLWEEMLARGNHDYITQLPHELTPIFERYDFPLLDYSNGAWIDLPDDYFFDGWHPSELANLRLYLNMMNALPDLLGQYSDANVLWEIVANATDTWEVFGSDNLPR